MRLHYVAYIVSCLVFVTGACMLVPLFFSMVYKDGAIASLLVGIALSMGVGGVGMAVLRPWCRKMVLHHREAMAIVALGWFIVGLAGSVPYMFEGILGNPTEAVFESVSAFTTTGASALPVVEIVPKGLLIWRAMSQWLGGMGFVVLSVALLPFFGAGGMQLYKTEAPGPAADKITPRVKDTAAILWRIYVILTAILIVLLMCCGMDFFDAICHAFSTMSTGGMSTRTASVAAFASPYIDVVITVFMFIGGINFLLLGLLLKGRLRGVWKDSELRFYFLSYVVSIIIISLALYGGFYGLLNQPASQVGLGETIRLAAFQVVSLGTSTGFATADYTLWPWVTQSVLILLMVVGGCSGSTAGGVKVIRFVILFKYAYQEIFRLVHPKSVRYIKLNHKLLPPEVISGVLGFFFIYMVAIAVGGLLLTAFGLDMGTAFSSVISCLGNVGPAFGSTGPAGNYADIPIAGKWVLIFCMIIGRLEIFTVLALFVPEFWRR